MKNVLITGGAGGIGKCIVEEFLKHDYCVYVLDNNIEGLDALRKCYTQDCLKIKCLDVLDREAMREYACSLDKEFEINHIITLAGRALEGEWIAFEQQSPDVIEQSIRLNLVGHINVISCFYPFLKSAKGNKSVLMISSINGMSCYGLPGYSAAKAGLGGFMNAVVAEFGQDNIRINTISPGTVVTEATLGEPKKFDELLKGTALNSFAEKEEVALLSYQICDSFKHMTGENIVLDAGQIKIHP